MPDQAAIDALDALARAFNRAVLRVRSRDFPPSFWGFECMAEAPTLLNDLRSRGYDIVKVGDRDG